MIPKIFLGCICMVLFISTAAAQDEVPQQVKEVFAEQYPEAEEVEYKDNLLNVQVHFTLNGEKMVANYTKKGRWRDTEKEASLESFPPEVKDGFRKSKYADWQVNETKLIYRAGGTERYRIKVEKNEVQKKYLFFNKAGRLVDESLTI